MSSGYWFDLTDPTSGLPVISRAGSALYPDVDGAAALLRYPTIQAGCCRVISHPHWGTSIYPFTFFTNASCSFILEAFDQLSVPQS